MNPTNMTQALHEAPKLIDILRRQTLALESSRILISEMNPNAMLRQLMFEVTKVVDAERSSLFLVDEERQELITQVAAGVDAPIRISMQHGIAGYVARTGEILNIPDAYADERFNPEVDKKTGFRTRNILCVPMCAASGEIVGVLEALNKIGGDAFDRYDEHLLLALASQSAVIYERAAFYQKLEEGHRQLIEAVVGCLDMRDVETEKHTIRDVKYTLRLAEEFDFDEETLRVIEWGAMLHDIGKIGIPDEILRKPGKLTDEEWMIMRAHPELGYQLVNQMDFLREAALIVRYHQEKYDGTGYPMGLAGEQIPIGARIFTLADAYDAMTSDRPYRKGMSDEQARTEIQRCSGTHFDPQVVEAFLRIPKQEWLDIHSQAENH